MARTSNFFHSIAVETEADVEALRQACAYLVQTAEQAIRGEVRRLVVDIRGAHSVGPAPKAAEGTPTPPAPAEGPPPAQ